MLRTILASCAVLLFSAGVANAGYIAGSNVNCRSAPRAQASVVLRLKQGEAASLQSRSSGWTLIGVRNSSCWVLSRYYSEGAQPSVEAGTDYGRSVGGERARSSARTSGTYRPSWVGLGIPAAKKPRRSSTARSARSTSRASRRGGSSWGASGSCPCSGGNVCIGPRGGRYCITSGGNKRYGM